jgi:hypothetical protein
VTPTQLAVAEGEPIGQSTDCCCWNGASLRPLRFTPASRPLPSSVRSCLAIIEFPQGNARKPRCNKGLNIAVLSERAIRSIPRQPQPNVEFTQ